MNRTKSATAFILVFAISVAHAQTPAAAEEYVRRGAEQLSRGDTKRAIADFTKAIEINPRHAEAHRRRGDARQKRGEFDGAITDYDRAIALDPQNADAYFGRAISRIERDDYAGGLEDIRIAGSLSPRYARGVELLDRIYIDTGRAQVASRHICKAIITFTKAIGINPRNPVAYFDRGNARNLANDFDGAIADYSKAIELAPDMWIAYANRAQVRRLLGDEDKVREDWLMVYKLQGVADPEKEYDRLRPYDEQGRRRALEMRRHEDMSPRCPKIKSDRVAAPR